MRGRDFAQHWLVIGQGGSRDLDTDLCWVNSLPQRILMMLCFNVDLHQHIQKSWRLNLPLTDDADGFVKKRKEVFE